MDSRDSTYYRTTYTPEQMRRSKRTLGFVASLSLVLLIAALFGAIWIDLHWQLALTALLLLIVGASAHGGERILSEALAEIAKEEPATMIRIESTLGAEDAKTVAESIEAEIEKIRQAGPRRHGPTGLSFR